MRSKKLLILYAFLLIVAVVTMVQLWRLNQRPQEIGPRDYPEIKEEGILARKLIGHLILPSERTVHDILLDTGWDNLNVLTALLRQTFAVEEYIILDTFHSSG